MVSRIVRANYTDRTIRVYQAYGQEIAVPALKYGGFVPPFKMTRMTWIKPSFNWMMYRSGYGRKPAQEVILAIDILREGFDYLLESATLSHFDAAGHKSHEEWQASLEYYPVRVQWDPERDWRINEIDGVRAIQIGLDGLAVQRYVNEWIVGISDVTPIAHALDKARTAHEEPPARPDLLEVSYPVSPVAQSRLMVTV